MSEVCRGCGHLLSPVVVPGRRLMQPWGRFGARSFPHALKLNGLLRGTSRSQDLALSLATILKAIAFGRTNHRNISALSNPTKTSVLQLQKLCRKLRHPPGIEEWTTPADGTLQRSSAKLMD